MPTCWPAAWSPSLSGNGTTSTRFGWSPTGSRTWWPTCFPTPGWSAAGPCGSCKPWRWATSCRRLKPGSPIGRPKEGWSCALSVDPASAGAAVRCDPLVVEQILFNLVDNACKYAGNGLPPMVELSAGRAAQGVVMRVRDHGPGIAPSDRRRVFRTFGKSAHQAANSAPGVGLGLGLSRRLARAMGGDLRLESSSGQGAAFVLTLRSQ